MDEVPQAETQSPTQSPARAYTSNWDASSKIPSTGLPTAPQIQENVVHDLNNVMTGIDKKMTEIRNIMGDVNEIRSLVGKYEIAKTRELLGGGTEGGRVLRTPEEIEKDRFDAEVEAVVNKWKMKR